uniref:Mitochondrial dicarboxylate carrier n=1 Tax=Strigamia maritima TaxID=126957 RepID=T1J1Y2_STRMM
MDVTRISRWYFGGISGAGAACITHPLDLLKVHLQTQQEGKLSLVRMTVHIVKKEGFFALYNGLTASILRQLSYSLVRFAIYEGVKNRITKPGENMPFYVKVLLAGSSGAAGGYIGTPADMVNVRMQNDIKLPPDQRRNYKHAIDGLWKVFKYEGIKNLFSGATTATGRAVLVTIGQLGMYDQTKQVLLESGFFHDNLLTHFTASLTAVMVIWCLEGAIATTLTQPLDVLKTRMMNAKPGEYKSVLHCAKVVGMLGPMAFFKGYIPAFIRLGPHTVLTFIIFEQLVKNFGEIVQKN